MSGSGSQVSSEFRQGLQTLLDRVALHWPESPYAFHAVVWEASQPNAFALPGGWVAVTTGLLEGAGSENELAFVLGHELGHFRGHVRPLDQDRNLDPLRNAPAAELQEGVQPDAQDEEAQYDEQESPR